MLTDLRKNEEGFVLITAIMIMALLLMMAVGMGSRSILNQQASLTEKQNTQAYYYAEAAISYIVAAINNDSELDGYNPPGPIYAIRGDSWELAGNLNAPGPTTLGGTDGQLRYFDNRSIVDRGTDNSYVFTGAGTQDFSSLVLPQHLVVEINPVTGHISLSGNPDPLTTQTRLPVNGAVVWMTASDQATDTDIAVSAPPYDFAIYALVYVDLDNDGVSEPVRLLRVTL